MEAQLTKSRMASGYRNHIKNGGKVGRKSGSIELDDEFIKKHTEVIKYLKKGYSYRQISVLTNNKSVNTIMKVKKTALKLQMLWEIFQDKQITQKMIIVCKDVKYLFDCELGWFAYLKIFSYFCKVILYGGFIIIGKILAFAIIPVSERSKISKSTGEFMRMLTSRRGRCSTLWIGIRPPQIQVRQMSHADFIILTTIGTL